MAGHVKKMCYFYENSNPIENLKSHSALVQPIAFIVCNIRSPAAGRRIQVPALRFQHTEKPVFGVAGLVHRFGNIKAHLAFGNVILILQALFFN